MKKIYSLALTCIWATTAFAQSTFPHDGLKDKDLTYILLRGATVHAEPGVSEVADLLVHQGRIIQYRPAQPTRKSKVPELPQNVAVYDYTGCHIYPGFIELVSSYGMPALQSTRREGRNVQYDRSQNKALYWNEAIHPEDAAVHQFKPDEKQAATLRALGFSATLSHSQNGIARGTSVLALTGQGSANEQVLITEAAAHFSLLKGNSNQNYPASCMGAVALLRQALHDAAWYRSARPDERNHSLEALHTQSALPWFFHAQDKYDLLRAARIAREFETTYAAYDSDGEAYQILHELGNGLSAIIAPLKMPAPFDLSDPDLSRYIAHSDLLHWERAPYNAMHISRAGIPLCLSANGLKDAAALFGAIARLRSTGLGKDTILAALTTLPAALVNAGHELGKIREGYIANFIICRKDPFEDPKAPIYEHWVQGVPYLLKDLRLPELKGAYDLNLNQVYMTLEVKGEAPSYSASAWRIQGTDTLKYKASLSQMGREITLQIAMPEGLYRLSGASLSENRIWDGRGFDPTGAEIPWSALRRGEKNNGKSKSKESKPDSTATTPKVTPPPARYPYTAFGLDSLPRPETLLIENATLWTNEAQGVIRGSILIHSGRIVAVGTEVMPEKHFPKGKTPSITRLDARGMHITPGIIDEHSHIAISRGVNEGTQASTAEVRIGDVLYPDDINIYRQLAGGVTTAQLLHGSANPIGGQSAIVKLRWGQGFEAMVMKEAPGFIKFALGENVKQSNWGDTYTRRYPQTRMGVEQFFYEYFHRARAYGEEKQKATLKGTRRTPVTPLRTDLEMEALLEILEGRRFITCHSYVQSEINMLMHVADSMGFTLNTFTHVLEGYKIAHKLRQHGAAASSFSDWWAYKYEVKDAIPHNASILNAAGVLTAINSDDAEMGRRLNQEAAKGIRYGGMSEEDALKMVTLNPAKMLHIDQWVGSLAPGKHADLVLWNGNPLSVHSRAEVTFVDGVRLFDRKRDAALRERDQAERARIAAAMLQAKEKGAETRMPERKMERYYHCDTEEEHEEVH